MEALDDTELMMLVRQRGDADALALLFERHQGPIHGFLYRLTGRTDTSEDLLQEVFLRVLRYARSYAPGAPFRPWLYRITRNVWADHRARFRLERSPEEHAEPLSADDEGPMARLVFAQDRERLMRALGRLPEGKRELLLLSREPGLSYQELADIYGCSVGALKVRVHRALQELRAHFFASEVR